MGSRRDFPAASGRWDRPEREQPGACGTRSIERSRCRRLATRCAALWGCPDSLSHPQAAASPPLCDWKGAGSVGRLLGQRRQRLGPARHARQCLGVVPRLVRRLFVSQPNKPYRTHEWKRPVGARLCLELRRRRSLLPRVGARLHLARQRLRQPRLPCRPDSLTTTVRHFRAYFGIAAVKTLGAPLVTRMSSSIRTPSDSCGK